jgi:predicted NBD/HSP70 family sugar kinase
MAGEIGHVPVDRSGPTCRCGRRGCFEMMASGTAIARRWPVATGEEPGAALFAAALAGEPAAVAIRDEVVGHIARGVELLALAYDVECILIGGGVASIGAPLDEALRSALAGTAGSPLVTDLDLAGRVRLAPTAIPLGPLGAALAARAAITGGVW